MSTYASPQIQIAITGRGVVSSIGEGADAFVDALLERRSGIVDGLAPCAEFDPEAAMSRRIARRWTASPSWRSPPRRRPPQRRACRGTSTSSGWRSSSAPASAG